MQEVTLQEFAGWGLYVNTG